MTQRLLTIHDGFPVDGGVCVVGVNADYDSLSDDEIGRRIGAKVVLQRSDGEIRPCDVLEIETMTSIGNKKNIALKLHGEVPEGFLKSGTEVFATA